MLVRKFPKNKSVSKIIWRCFTEEAHQEEISEDPMDVYKGENDKFSPENNNLYADIIRPNPKIQTGCYNIQHLDKYDRYPVNFTKELELIQKHEMFINRPKLGYLMKTVYIPLFLAKSVAPFLYNDSTDFGSYINKVDETNRYFVTSNNKEEYILGIQSLFGNVGAAIVSNKGRVISDERKFLFKHRNNEGNVSKEVLDEFAKEYLPNVVESAMKESRLDFSRIKAIAVTVGPGETYSLAHGLEYAKKLGIDKSIPVYPVNNHEAHIFANRMSHDMTQKKSPLKFPFVSIIASSKITQIVLSQGVGSHRIFGTSIDIGVGDFLDRSAMNLYKAKENLLLKVKSSMGDEKANKIDKILNKDQYYGGEIFENLAEYGDASQVAFSIPMIKDNSTDMSFTGLLTTAKNKILVKQNPKSPEYVEGIIQDNFFDILASLQFVAFRQIDIKSRRWFEMFKKFKVQPNWINLAGGCSQNKALTNLITEVGKDYETFIISPNNNYVQDNPASVAWMGWEYLNAARQTDIRDKNIYPLSNIPLGNYVDLVSTSFKGIIQHKKIGSKWQRKQAGNE